MAEKVFDASKKYRCRLYGVTFSNFPEKKEPALPGVLASDTVEVVDPVFGREEFAVFTVDSDPQGAYPPSWVGTYRLPMSAKSAWFGGEISV